MDFSLNSKRYFYEKFSIFKTHSEVNNLIIKIEEDATNNGLDVKKDTARLFIKNFKQRWNQSNRMRQRFEEKNESWLDSQLYDFKSNACVDGGRKKTRFADLSDSQKRRITCDLRNEETEVLTFAASSALRKDGRTEAAKLLKESLQSPRRASKIMTAYSNISKCTARKMSADEALVLYLNCDLSKNQYFNLRKSSIDFGMDIYPSYNEILNAKNLCYPEGTTINESEIRSSLQDLLNHNLHRLLMCLPESSLSEKICVLYKVGFDGSSGHSEYKHVFAHESVSDSSVVITIATPIIIVSETDNSILWQNLAPSSTNYCKPLRLAYEKENTDSIKAEYNRINNEINNLKKTEITLENISVTATHKLFLTMFDMKCINVIETNKITQACYICKSSGSSLNDLSQRTCIMTQETREKLKYGLSPLHARIKFMEFILKLSYRLVLPEPDRKKGSKLSKSNKLLLEERKKYIQKEIKKKLGLNLDMPKQGFGSTNDENTARKFFKETTITSQITEIDVNLLTRFGNILIAISTSQEIDGYKFGEYAFETAKLLVNTYNWWPMSPTVHKVLLHGQDIINYGILPVGQMSEEALEHCNKKFKLYKSNFARRNSRINNLQDIYNRFMLMSDPYICHLRLQSKKNHRKVDLPEDVQNLLIYNDYSQINENENQSDDEKDEI